MDWNHYQEAIFEDITQGHGHLVVEALAGTGKTTTIEEAVRRLLAAKPGTKVLATAFNKSIADVLQKRLPEKAEARTFHSLGFGALKRTWGQHVTMSDGSDLAMVINNVPQSLTYEDKQTIKSLVSLAKAFLAETREEVAELMEEYQLMPEPRGDEVLYRDYVNLYLDATLQILQQTCKPHDEVSFDDMVYVPAKLNMRTGFFDVVFVDETQDMNKAQIQLARNAVKADGRLVLVGDAHQAIYGWRGADQDAMRRLSRELGARRLPLSLSYRCPKRVAQEARKYVPAFEVPDDAKPGTVRQVSESAMEEQWREGDYVLSRTNAPLFHLCLRAIQLGHRACIQGSDLSRGLKAMVKKARAQNVIELLDWVVVWENSEVAKALAADKEHKVSGIRDRANAIYQISEGLNSLDDLMARVWKLTNALKGPHILFSTVHKVKGLEADRVWMLASTFRPHKSQEEKNLWYVAVTRSKDELFLVDLQEKPPHAMG